MASTWWDQAAAPPSAARPGVAQPVPNQPPIISPPAPTYSGSPEGGGSTPPAPGQPGGGPIQGQHGTPDGNYNTNTGTYTPKDPTPRPGYTFNPGTGYWTKSAAGTDTTNYGQGAAGANAEFLAWLNKTKPNASAIPGMVDQINQKYGLTTGHGLQWYPDRNVVAASGGGYWAVGGDGNWGYNVGDSQGGGKTPIDPGTLGTLLQPFGEAPPSFSLPTYKTPDPFKPPSADDVLKDDGYIFRRDQGEKVLENSASARGLTNSGGTLKDILDYGQNAASQEYQNVFNRDLGVYQTNVQSQNLDPYKFAYQQGLDTNNQNWNQYLQKYAQFRNQQTDSFNRLYGFASLGAQTAGA